MLSQEELKELAKIRAEDDFFVSFYLNVDPLTNTKGDYMIHVKNMLKQTAERLDKTVLKRISSDLGKIEAYILSNKRIFKKGLAILSCQEKNFWREFHLSVPIKNEVIVDKTPYIKPLLDILDNYEKYGVLLADKESARVFMVHLGEIVEYREVHGRDIDIPGKHKKGGWFALSQNHYARHVDFHVTMHLKDLIEKLDSFLSGRNINRLIIGGPDEAVVMVKGMLHKTILDKIVGTVKIEMFAKIDEVLKKIEPVVAAFEKKEEEETVETLITKAMKNENAVIGMEDVLNALQEGRIMKLIFLKDYKQSGSACKKCGYLSVRHISICPYCKGEIQEVNYIVDLAAQKAVQQGSFVEVTEENKKLQKAGSIGAFLRF